MTRLSNSTINQVSAKVKKPAYNRAVLSAGVAHIGVGGFHRAHQALYLDDIAAQGETAWGLCGIGLLPGDIQMDQALRPQDLLYTVVEQDIRGSAARIVGSMKEFFHAPSAAQATLEKLCDPSIKIVSMTITEGGYNIDQTTGKFLTDNPDLKAEIAARSTPRSVFGYVIGALAERRKRGIAPFTVLSCDNLLHNGKVAAHAFCCYTEMVSTELAEWVRSNVTFPNTMVDRITPATTDQTRTLAQQLTGLEDAWPVACESFRQWVVEDNFCNSRPALEAVGVQMTSDVSPYEHMKIRLLNAGHSAIGYLGYLCGFEHIFEIMADKDFQIFIRCFWEYEVTPHVGEVPGVNLTEYKQSLFERFSNPNIRDQSLRICSDGSNKLPKFLLPTVRDALAKGSPIKLMSLVVASWMRFVNGIDEKGSEIPLSDPRAALLVEHARKGMSDPQELLSIEEIFGDLGQNKTFRDSVANALEDIYALGARKTLLKYLAA